MTPLERKYLGRKKTDSKERFIFWFVVFLVSVFAVCYYVDTRTNATTVHAAEVEEIHQNDYYCQHISDYINGSDPKITKICTNI